MLKFYRNVFATGVLALGLAACGDDVVVTDPPPPVDFTPNIISFTVAPGNVVIAPGNTSQAATTLVTKQGVTGSVTWTTSNAAVATVSATGLITAVAPGNATIEATASAGGQTAKAQVGVTVSEAANILSFTVSPSTVALARGADIQAAANLVTRLGQTGTVTWASSNTAVATVSNTGRIVAVAPGVAVVEATATAGGQTAKAQIGVTVTEVQNILSFTVSPATLDLVRGEVSQPSAELITKQGVSGTVAWASSNTSIATVNATTGSITAVAPGTTIIRATATAGGQTATADIGVTVRELIAAQLSISSVTTGAGVPVALANVNGQIEVTMNFAPGEEDIERIEVLIGSQIAATQTYAASPAAGNITLSINTANYVKNATAGTATPDFLNGPTAISARLIKRAGTTGAGATNTTTNASNTVAIVLNNLDGVAAEITRPTRSTNDAGGLTFWGGPGAAGRTSAQLYPVIYTPGRSLTSATWLITGCTAVVTTAAPHTVTYTTGAEATATLTACPLESAALQNVAVAAALDNTNSPIALALIPNTVVFGSTPDPIRLDYVAPNVPTPSIVRAAPAVTGWVNGTFNFLNFTSFDGGVGLRATSDAAVFYNAPNCGGATGVAMPTGTGADIPECATNAIGGALGIGNGTAPYSVYATESDRLGNAGMSPASVTFGVDKTVPSIRWGTNTDAAYAAKVVGPADSQYTTKPGVNDEFRVEYIDERSGFLNGVGVNASQVHALSTAGHVNNTGLCVVGLAPIGASFVTAPGCGMVGVAAIGVLRADGWQAGPSISTNAAAEGYWGYASAVSDAAGNASATVFRKVVVSARTPFSTNVGIPASMGAAGFNFALTAADSTETVAQSLQLEIPAFGGLTAAADHDSVRYSRTAVGTVFDNVITSPYSGLINPTTPTPYVRHFETVDNTVVFPASNVRAAPTNTKPTSVLAWSWNPGSLRTGGPAATASTTNAIPALNVENGVPFALFNTINPTNALTHFRIISTVASSNQFGSTAALRAQAVSPTTSPNSPFVRVDFYRYVAAENAWHYIGSSSTPISTDQGTYRSWLYAAPATASLAAAWNGAAPTAIVSTNKIAAVGVTAAGDGIVAGATMVP